MERSWKDIIAWIIGSGLIFLSLLNFRHLEFWEFIKGLVFFLPGLYALPPVHERILEKFNINLPKLHILITPVIAFGILIVAAATGQLDGTTSYTEQEIKEQATNLSEIGYENIIRDFKEYEHDTIYYKGKVIDTLRQGDGYVMLIATKQTGSHYRPMDYRDNIVYTDYSPELGVMEIQGDRPLKGDILKVWAEYIDPTEYGTAANNVKTVPGTSVLHAERVNQTG